MGRGCFSESLSQLLTVNFPNIVLIKHMGIKLFSRKIFLKNVCKICRFCTLHFLHLNFQRGNFSFFFLASMNLLKQEVFCYQHYARVIKLNYGMLKFLLFFSCFKIFYNNFGKYGYFMNNSKNKCFLRWIFILKY